MSIEFVQLAFVAVIIKGLHAYKSCYSEGEGNAFA